MHTKRGLAVRRLKKQRKKDYLKKKALTKKEIDQSLAGLSMNDQILKDTTDMLVNKGFQHDVILSLILEHDKKLNEFVKSRLKEVGQHNKSQDKK